MKQVQVWAQPADRAVAEAREMPLDVWLANAWRWIRKNTIGPSKKSKATKESRKKEKRVENTQFKNMASKL